MIDRHRPGVVGLVVLWTLFVAICFGLGYPTLRRYDPRDPRTNFDGTTALYHWQVTGDPQEGNFGPSLVHFRYRLLVPALARPFYQLGKGHVGTWDPGYFGLLVANSLLCASTALLLFLVARDSLGDRAPALVPPLLYLMSFGVPNFLLAGIVDSGEAFSLMALIWCLHTKRWRMLPLIGIMGVFAKETFLPFSVAIAAGWLIADRGAVPSRSTRLVSLGLLALAGVATLTTIFSVANGRFVPLWELGRSGTIPNINSGIVGGLARIAEDVGLLYMFAWLAPIGLLGLARCPRPWILGAGAGAVTAIALGVFNGEPGLARSLFDILGPLLCLGSAATLSNLHL